MVKENITRKIDNLGRISIPKGMRDRFEIAPGDDLEFYTTIDGFICMRKVGYVAQQDKYKIAAQVLAELGYDIPDEIRGGKKE